MPIICTSVLSSDENKIRTSPKMGRNRSTPTSGENDVVVSRIFQAVEHRRRRLGIYGCEIFEEVIYVGSFPVVLRNKRQVGVRFREVPAQGSRRRHCIFVSLLGNCTRNRIIENDAQLAFILAAEFAYL